MGRYLFSFSEVDGEQARRRLRARMWGISDAEPRRHELAAGDLVLVYVVAARAFIGRAEIASAVHEWTPLEAEAYPGEEPGGVSLSGVEEWDPAVLLDAVVSQIDPRASNPIVQANARAGFRTSVVRITADEYEGALAVGRRTRGT